MSECCYDYFGSEAGGFSKYGLDDLVQIDCLGRSLVLVEVLVEQFQVGPYHVLPAAVLARCRVQEAE